MKLTLCHRHSGPVGFLGFLCFFVFLFFFVFWVLLTFDLLYLLLVLNQILQNRSASLPVCVLAVEGDNMRLADAMSATEHLLLRELPTHVHVGRFSGGTRYFFIF